MTSHKGEDALKAETVSRLMALFAIYIDNPTRVYIIAARLLGVTDRIIGERLGYTAMRICQMRREIIESDALLAAVLDSYTPPHPALPGSIVDALRAAGRAQTKPHKPHKSRASEA